MTQKTISTVDYIKDFFEKNSQAASIGGLVLLGMCAGIYYYVTIYRPSVQQSASIALSDSLLEASKAQRNPELLDEVILAAKTGYQQFSNSTLAPYFQALEADALIQENKIAEGRELLQKVVASLSSSSPFYYQYALKLARIKVDDQDQQLSQAGLAELIKLSQEKHAVKDEALYYLGDYYEHHNQVEKAREVWQQLKALASEKEFEASVWIQAAQNKLI